MGEVNGRMNHLSQEIIQSYQLRKSRKDKTRFLDMLTKVMNHANIPYKIEKMGILKSQNVIIGNPETAKIVISAHYDTAGVMPCPNFISLNMWKTIQYQLPLIAYGLGSMLLFMIVKAIFFPWIPDFLESITWFFTFYCILIYAIDNPNTSNDNTSGVLGICELMLDPEIDFDKVCLVLFDHEEWGLFGSAAFSKKYKRIKKEVLLLNLDCIGVGDHIRCILNQSFKKDEKTQSYLKDKMIEADGKSIDIVFASYPSDQIHFKKGVGVASFCYDKSKNYYIDNIHTKKDTVLDETNILFIVKFIKSLW